MTEDDKKIYYTADQALEKATELGIDVTLATLLNWVDKKNLGFQPGGSCTKWFIYKEKFDLFIRGKLEKNHGENK